MAALTPSSPVKAYAALDPATEGAARAFMRQLKGRYPVREAFLFGSRARHAHGPESDADIAVVLCGKHRNRSAIVRDMAGIAFHVMMDTGVMVEALPLFEDEFEHPEMFNNPSLIDAIRREGLRL
jgi:hypothetical protein